ncbi:MAG: hypothetical protein JNM86_08505 [Phycisphaerae bacterium]|nr:hypothetical protein [Phycisphaerae bacterium]
MMDHNGGSQTERVAAAAVLTTTADLRRAASNARAVALDAIAWIAHGLDYAAGVAAYDDPIRRDGVAERLFVPDAGQRAERADMLRRLAAALDDPTAPTAADLEACLPDAWADRIVADAMKDTMVRRVAAIGLGPSDLRTLRAHQDLALRRGSVGLFLARMRTLGRVAVRMFDARPESDTGTSSP